MSLSILILVDHKQCDFALIIISKWLTMSLFVPSLHLGRYSILLCFSSKNYCYFISENKSNRLLLLCKTSLLQTICVNNVVVSMGKRKDMIHPRFLSEYIIDI